MKHFYILFSFITLSFLSSVAFAQCTVSFTHTENGLVVDASATGVGTATVPVYGYDWGDATAPSIGANATHTYAAAGTYTVCVSFFDLLDTSACNATFCADITVGSGVSIKEIDEPFTLSLYPNPATTTIELASNEQLETVMIYNTLGTLVYQEKIQGNSAKISVNDFPKGVYLLRCNGMTKRFVKK
jgi:PKD repeat protein